MRVAYLSTDPGISFGGAKGAAIHLGEVVEALDAAGADVLLVVAAVAPDAPLPAGVTLATLPYADAQPSLEQRLELAPQMEAWLESALRAFGAEVLYERIALHSTMGARVAARLAIPHLVEINAPLVDEAARYRGLERPELAAAMEREVLAGADLVLAVSSPLAEHAQARGATSIRVLPNAVAMEPFKDVPARPDSPLVAVFAGAFRPWHGAGTIAAAWRLLGSDAPALRVVGDGPGAEALRRVDAEMMGWVPHDAVPAALASAHIGLAPYTLDAPRYFSPLKLFEYLAAGLAVIAADLPGVVEVVDRDTAVIVPAGDVTALAAAVRELASDAPRREALGRAGRDLVAANHTWRHRATEILEAAQALCARSREPASAAPGSMA